MCIAIKFRNIIYIIYYLTGNNIGKLYMYNDSKSFNNMLTFIGVSKLECK